MTFEDRPQDGLEGAEPEGTSEEGSPGGGSPEETEGAPEAASRDEAAPAEPASATEEPTADPSDLTPPDENAQAAAAAGEGGGAAPEPEGRAQPGDQPGGDGEPGAAPERRPPRRRTRDDRKGEQPEVVPGADLEPDLVLDEPERAEQDEYGTAYADRYAEPEADAEAPPAEPEEAPAREEAPSPRTPMELAADARYQATGKRKTSVARVILKPGNGTYTVNGRSLDQFFPRHGLRATARQPLSAAGYESRMDVVARLHGGGVSAQAGALRHGVARALVEADPSLREDLKRRGYLTRDPRAKERKKAGLKKARKRPQFSKR